jgi:cytochrome c553
MKWIGVGLAGLVGVVILAIAVVYGVTSRRISKVYTFSDPPLAVPTDSGSMAQGRHFVEAIGKCAACHGDNLTGKVVVDNPVMGTL